MFAFDEKRRAATAATIGADIDVPDSKAVEFVGNALLIRTPGAARCTYTGEKLLNLANLSCLSVAATVNILFKANAAGYSREKSINDAALPAAATNK